MDLKEIEDRANAATKGPWSKSDSLVTSNEGLICATCFISVTSFQIDLNAKFISHAREDVPALIAEVRRLRAIIEGRPTAPTEQPPCTGLSAGWCPRCGDCCCQNRERAMDDTKCPLHARTSEHATERTECGECSGRGWVKVP